MSTVTTVPDMGLRSQVSPAPLTGHWSQHQCWSGQSEKRRRQRLMTSAQWVGTNDLDNTQAAGLNNTVWPGLAAETSYIRSGVTLDTD